MTMPATTQPNAHTQILELPPPGYPMVTRVITEALFPSEGRAEVTWVVSKPHPLVPTMNIVRMFVEPEGVAIYSVSADGKTGMRNFVKTELTRLVEEAMPIAILVEELADAESGDDVDEVPEAPQPPQGPQAVPTPDDSPDTATDNGQPDAS